jgi:hypothetical protein
MMVNIGDLGHAVEPSDIDPKSTGRLVAKFLRSFFPDLASE